jgi:hypothetical protein
MLLHGISTNWDVLEGQDGLYQCSGWAVILRGSGGEDVEDARRIRENLDLVWDGFWLSLESEVFIWRVLLWNLLRPWLPCDMCPLHFAVRFCAG